MGGEYVDIASFKRSVSGCGIAVVLRVEVADQSFEIQDTGTVRATILNYQQPNTGSAEPPFIGHLDVSQHYSSFELSGH